MWVNLIFSQARAFQNFLDMYIRHSRVVISPKLWIISRECRNWTALPEWFRLVLCVFILFVPEQLNVEITVYETGVTGEIVMGSIILSLIWKVPFSYISRDTRYLDLGYCGLFKNNAGIVTCVQPRDKWVRVTTAWHRDKWVPVTTTWRVLRLRTEERPPDMEGSCEYIE